MTISLYYGTVNVPVECDGPWNCSGESPWKWPNQPSSADNYEADHQIRVFSVVRSTERSALGQRAAICALLVSVLASWPSPVDAQGTGFRTEVFFGGGGVIADEGIVSFDVGATAWLAERWGLGAWGTFPTVVGRDGTGGLLFAPAIRYQRRLRRGRSLHLAAGPGYADSNAGPVTGAEWRFFPYADIMYGVQAAGNRKFGLRAGARLIGGGLQLVAVLGFTTD